MSDTPISIEKAKRFIPLSGLSEAHIEDVLAHSKTFSLPAGKVVFKRNTPAQGVFYLAEGALDLCDTQFQVSPLRGGSSVSRHPIGNTTGHHQVTAVTTKDSVILQIDSARLDLVLTWNQAGNYLMSELDSHKPLSHHWMTNLLLSPTLTKVPPAHIQKLLTSFKALEVCKGDVVIREGSTGEQFYVIQSGTAVVTQTQGNGERTLATLGPGDSFGEEALISDSPRNASVTMTSDGVLMSLQKQLFMTLLHAPNLKYIDPSEPEFNRDAVLLDIRLASEYEHLHQDKSINIPLSHLPDNLAHLSKDKAYVVLGDHSSRSQLGTYLLTEAGFDAMIAKASNEPKIQKVAQRA